MRRFTLPVALSSALIGGSVCAAAATRNIMITGYWPPTADMVERFSTNPELNPSGWIGDNWEGRGYNVYSFFPSFENNTFPIGTGDFEVDYQDTSEDWWRITEEVKPLAIITFSRGNDDLSWEVEWRQKNRANWQPDYRAPTKPTPSPPDNSVPAEYIRYSTLPMDDIVANVERDVPSLDPFVDRRGFGGGFVSEFIAYHGTWYHDLHANPSDPDWNIAAGHIHVGIQVPLADAIAATDSSLRTLIDYLDTQVPEPSTGLILLIAAPLARRMRMAYR